jgi:hypothetical protein
MGFNINKGIILLVLVLILSGCSSGPGEVGDTATETVVLVDEGDTYVYEGKAAEEKLEVSLHQFKSNEFGDLLVLGMMTNRSDETLGNAEITLDLLDATGTVVASDSIAELSAGLAPGASIPFYVLFSEQYLAIDTINASVVSVGALAGEVLPLAFQKVNSSRFSNGVFYLVGEIVNPNTDPVLISLLRGATFSNDGKLTTVFSCKVCPLSIEAGASAPFSMLSYNFIGMPGAYDDFQLYGSGIPVSLPEAVELEVSDEQFACMDQMSNYHVIGEVVNTGDLPAQASLLGAIYDPDGNLVDVSTTSVLPGLIPAGTTGYYDFKFEGSYRDAPIDIAGHRWNIAVDPISSRCFEDDQAVVLLETREDNFTAEGNGGIASGYVVNTSEEMIELAYLVVLLRDPQSGKVVSLGTSDIPGLFEPGDGVPFSILLFTPLDINSATLTLETFVVGRTVGE